MSKERVLVLMGGYSEERDVSLRSGTAVLKALQSLDYEAEGMDLKDLPIQNIVDFNPDLVFIALHGKDGEDGTVQGLLEILNIRYTGSGVAASAIGIDKILTKKILSYEGIPTPPFTILNRNTFTASPRELAELIGKIGVPMVIKASTQGSSIGVYIVHKEEGVAGALEAAFAFDHNVLVEQFLDGIEVTSTVMGNEYDTEALPLIEITSENEFYDFESKYTPGMCSHIIPARVDEDVQAKVARLSQQVFKNIGCRGVARVDFIIDRNNNPFVLEINTIPGMTEMSLVPDAARAKGISFEQLVDKIVRLGLETPAHR